MITVLTPLSNIAVICIKFTCKKKATPKIRVVCSLVLQVPGIPQGSMAQVGSFMSVGQLSVEIFPLKSSAVIQAITMGTRFFETTGHDMPQADGVQGWWYVLILFLRSTSELKP
jgi:hypothetical protein